LLLAPARHPPGERFEQPLHRGGEDEQGGEDRHGALRLEDRRVHERVHGHGAHPTEGGDAEAGDDGEPVRRLAGRGGCGLTRWHGGTRLRGGGLVRSRRLLRDGCRQGAGDGGAANRDRTPNQCHRDLLHLWVDLHQVGRS
jgi:hypothetical protein